MTRRQFLLLILPLLAVLLGLIATFVIDGRGGLGAPAWDDDLAARVRGAMSREFVWGVGEEDGRKVWEANFNALNAWVQTFDSYARIVPPWEVAVSREQSSGQYVGIGIRIEQPRKRNGPFESVLITGVKPDGPADKAGVAIGDRILAVGGKPVPELTPGGDDQGLQNAIRGPSGAPVVLRLRGPDGGERDARVTRGRIDKGSVFGVRMIDAARHIGYIRVEAFQASTSRDFKAAVERLTGEGMRALILDLRINGGGLMDQAIAIADLFLADGVIVRQRGRREAFTETYEATADGTLSSDLSLAILIDGRSASASEILAGALQDHRRAVLVGERTFGKFLVQVVEEINTDVGVALFKRTTSIYETPHGHSYARTKPSGRFDPLAGIVPDFYVAAGNGDFRKLYDIFVNMSYADWNPDQEPVHPDFVDYQLDAALAVLRGETYYPPLLAEE